MRFSITTVIVLVLDAASYA